MNHEEKRKGEFQHKLFKFAVLIIVFVFFCLIVGFIYVEFFGSANTDTTNAIFEINNERYNYLNPFILIILVITFLVLYLMRKPQKNIGHLLRV